jgi:hypothetical protein
LQLNEGFTVKYFKIDGQPPLDLGIDHSNQTTAYQFYKPNDTVQLSSIENLRIVYTGAFPTYQGEEITSSDDMGVIAIKDGILRATVQSVFIPELVDKTTNQYFHSYTYDLTVRSPVPLSVYLNGSAPQRGTQLRFTAAKPYDFLIYAGAYNFVRRNNLYLLNTSLAPQYVDVLAAATNQISGYYAKVMGMPYDGEVVFAQIFSIGPKDLYPKWAFTVTPTIVMDVDELREKIDLKAGKISDVATFTILAHEMAHKYFMQQLNASGTRNLWRFYHESLAQYLAYKALEDLVSPAAYAERLRQYSFTDEYLKKQFVPFDQLETSDAPLTNASYFYYPLYLVGFEKQFGRAKTNELLRQLVLNKDQFTRDAGYYKTCALRAGITGQQWQQYATDYLESRNCLPQLAGLVH